MSTKISAKKQQQESRRLPKQESKRPPRSQKISRYVYLYGKHPIIAALENNRRKIMDVYCLEKFFAQNRDLLTKHNVKLVDSDYLRSLVGDDVPHQGIVALAEKLKQPLFKELNLSNLPRRIAIIDQITDPQNIGAIIRSAAAFGIDTVVTPADGCPEESGAIVKAACGCFEQVNYLQVSNLRQFLEHLKKNNFWIAGLDARGKDKMSDAKKIEKLAIIIGSEHKGMRRLTKENCDFLISIPISPKVESLNAASAASIIFFNLTV